ncbi:MAG: hypothetical protein ABR606_16420 [Vicinamibacterales bacterium]
MHPSGSMAQMLAAPQWLLGHSLVDAGFAALLVGLELLRRQPSLPAATRRWVVPALVATLLQTIEMAVHAAAYIDLDPLLAGSATPVLSTHLALSVAVYPIFGAVLAAFIAACSRERVLGSPKIGWIGIVGAIGHGLSAPLVVGFDLGWAGILFPFIVFLGLWILLAGASPVRRAAHQYAAASARP